MIIFSGILRRIFLLSITVVTVSCKSDPEPLVIAGGGHDINYNFTNLTPRVIPVGYSGDVLLEINSMNTTNLILQTAWQETIELNDNGANGDKRAGDKIFSVFLNAKKILGMVQPNDIFRPYVGRIQLAQGYLSIFAEVSSSDIPLLSPIKISNSIQQTPHLVNLVSDRISPDNLTDYIKTFYSVFEDEYDFIVIIYPGYNLNRHHIDVKLNIDGIGKRQYDVTDEYGSSGRLLGINVFPNARFFDGASVGYQHELGHYWVSFLDIPSLRSARPHWPLSDLANSIMGYSPGGGQGLSFPFDLESQGENSWLLKPRANPASFNDLDLYLMGLLPAEEVVPHIVFENQNQVSQTNAVLTGPIEILSIDKITNEMGVREPSSANSQKKFEIATIIVTQTPLSDYEMSFYDYFSARAELKEEVTIREGFSVYKGWPFYLSTGNRGELVTTFK